MNLTRNQLELLAKYFSDISKILVASTVIGFFVPMAGVTVNTITFIVGFSSAIIFISLGVRIIKF